MVRERSRVQVPTRAWPKALLQINLEGWVKKPKKMGNCCLELYFERFHVI
uniref:Uncharacterized protein n=1 Tax=uncultured Prochlorococcus marinus clone ASNC2259 TaxID=379367 RepID=Q1PL22_PROMR|nr:hypothetical protein ASNC2259_0006 [uncultured Prochlorococcus marinus clone ASNC2259]